MEQRVDDESLTEEARANFNYALGKAYEDRGNYDQAFSRYDRGASSNVAQHDQTGSSVFWRIH